MFLRKANVTTLFPLFFLNDVYLFLQADSSKGLIELVLVEARDLVAADLRGTSDPYVRVQYGEKKQRTKVMNKLFWTQ